MKSQELKEKGDEGLLIIYFQERSLIQKHEESSYESKELSDDILTGESSLFILQLEQDSRTRKYLLKP